jgi:hypothetical protein
MACENKIGKTTVTKSTNSNIIYVHVIRSEEHYVN